jgi:CBS domain-containing membrane protein
MNSSFCLKFLNGGFWKAGNIVFPREKREGFRMPLLYDPFKKSPGYFIGQSLLAAASLALILIFSRYFTQAALVASFGATTFIAFALPHSVPGRPRNIIGGYIVGIGSGLILFFLLRTWPLAALAERYESVLLSGGALAVGLSIFVMTVLGLGHPPAAGVALCFAVSGWSWDAIFFMLLFVTLISAVKTLLIKRMVNLL